jgi:hypothetical protein
MLDDLLKAKKITSEQYEAYMVFHMSEVGRNWFNRMLMETFMSEAPPELMLAGALAHLEGRRSIIRQIKLDIDTVEQLLAEGNYVGSEPRPEPEHPKF